MLAVPALSRDEFGRAPSNYADLQKLAARYAREHLASHIVLNQATQLAITLASDDNANYSVKTHHGDFDDMMRSRGPNGISPQDLLFGAELPQPVNPRSNDPFGGL